MSIRPTFTRTIASLLLLSMAAGCAVEPWVKPYHRDKLASPVMSYDRNPVADNYMHHVRQAREAARGAEGAGGGGCGCN